MSEEERRPRGVGPIVPGAVLKGRYRIERLLGHGGMAAVWLAEDPVLERPVAVKVLSDTIASDPEFLARFRREAHVAASLSHPNLIDVYDYAEAEERPYLVMEYVPGGSLAARVKHGGAIDAEQVARQLLGALAHIHAAGIVHRDVKPQNLLLGRHGEVKLIDFGIALPPDATAITRTGHLIGTARYIAPEVMGGAAATERSDLYSCGIVLRECPTAAGGGELAAIVERLCDPEPARRPASARAALGEIERATAPVEEPIELIPVAATPAGASAEAPAEGRRPRHPGRFRVAAALGIVAAALALFLVVLTDGSETPSERGAQAGREGGPQRQGAAGQQRGQGEGAGSATAVAAVPRPAGADPSAAGSLNEEGFALIQEGRYAEAVPVLEAAVRAFPPGTEDLNYAYALFNLGNALRLDGRPADAIPVLEQRLRIPNQTATVREELEAARAEVTS